MTSSDPETIVVLPSWRATAPALGICAGFVVAGGVTGAEVATLHLPRVAVVVIGVVLAVSAAVFLLGGLILITRIIRRKPLLVISDEGVTTDDFFAGVGFVRWDELRGVGERCIGRSSPLLAIDARHPDLIIERQRSPLKRASLRYNIRHGGGIVNIAEGMIAMDHGELLAAIAERIDHSRHRPDGRGRKRR